MKFGVTLTATRETLLYLEAIHDLVAENPSMAVEE